MAKIKQLIFGRKRLAAMAAIVILLAAAGGTLAFLTSSTPAVTNTFTPAQVSCEVLQPDTVKTASVKNTSDIDAYLRADITLNWVNEDGLYAPVQPDCRVVVNPNWIKHTDGYYYYTERVVPGATVALITDISEGSNAPVDHTQLKVTVQAEAIQADPFTDYKDAWSQDPGPNVTFGN